MRYQTLIALTFALAGAAACGSSTPTSPSSTGGTLNVMLKDSPFSDAKALLVTFSEVSAHRSDQPDANWSTLPFSGGATTRTCDLKKLQSAQDVLGTGPLSPGHYTQIRLTVSSATIYFDNASSGSACATTIAAPAGRSASVDVPSGEVRLTSEFDVVNTSSTNLLLDFNGDQSIRDTGNGRYMMSPVITVVSVQ